MVLRQCVACNHRISGTKKTCVCGHVFTHMKMIGGKRYSGSRAMSYQRSRVPKGKRSAGKSTGCRLMIHKEKKAKMRLGSNAKQKRLSKEMTVLPGVSKQLQRVQTVTDVPCLSPSHSESPELLEKLNDALNDINKRIARQSLLWIVLKSSKY